MPHRKSVTQCKCSKRNWQCLQAFLGLCVCARPQLPVPIWMERSTLLWDRVCVWCGAQPPSPLRPRLHLHPTSKWILLPVPPGGCGALLRERLQNGFITVQCCLFFKIYFSRRDLHYSITALFVCLFSYCHQWSILQQQPVFMDVIPTHEDSAQDCRAAAVPAFIGRWHPCLHCTTSQCQSWWGHSIPI